MMRGQPDASDLLRTVRDFLIKRAIPSLEGYAAFEARIAASLLGIARREIEAGARLGEVDQNELARLLQHTGDAGALEAELLELIRADEVWARWDDVLSFLRRRAERELEIANPKYLEQ